MKEVIFWLTASQRAHRGGSGIYLRLIQQPAQSVSVDILVVKKGFV
jgi:hypothetical protein